jgi:hypothetical protein
MGNNLKGGLTTSCGCYSIESHKKHGLTNTPEYMSWQHMKDRCLNPESDNYPGYGGRGIGVCDRWQGEDGFENFLADLGPRPEGTTLDRWPNNKDGHYEPGNCRWGTGGEQMRNTRRTHWIEYNGERKVLTDWVKWLGMRHSEFYRHLRKGKTGPEVIEYYLKKRADASNSGQHIEHN